MAASNQNFPLSVTLQQMINHPNIIDDGSGIPLVELIVDTYNGIKGGLIESILKRLPRVNKITLKPTDNSYADEGSRATHHLGWQAFAAEVLKSDLTITSISLSSSGTLYFIGCIDELVKGKCISSLSMEIDPYFTLHDEADLFRDFLTEEDCPVTDLRIVIQSDTDLAVFASWFDSAKGNQTTRIKHLTIEQSETTPGGVLERFPSILDFNKTGSKLVSNVRVLTFKGFKITNTFMRTRLVDYLMSNDCKPLIAVCLVNIFSTSDTPEEDWAAKVVESIEQVYDRSWWWRSSTYKAISASNQPKTQHAYVLVKWVPLLSNASMIQLAFVNDLADKWKSFMTTLNNEFSADCKTNKLEFDVDKEIIELKHAAMQQVLGLSPVKNQKKCSQ